MRTQKQIEGLIVSEFQELKRLELCLARRLSRVNMPSQTIRRSLAQSVMDLDNKASRLEELLTLSMNSAGPHRSSLNAPEELVGVNA